MIALRYALKKKRNQFARDLFRPLDGLDHVDGFACARLRRQVLEVVELRGQALHPDAAGRGQLLVRHGLDLGEPPGERIVTQRCDRRFDARPDRACELHQLLPADAELQVIEHGAAQQLA